MFLLGATQLVLVMTLWFVELLARRFAAPLPFVIASTWVHTVLMLYGVYIFFICGFLFTVFPRWMNGTEVSRRRYMTVALTVKAHKFSAKATERIVAAGGSVEAL